MDASYVYFTRTLPPKNLTFRSKYEERLQYGLYEKNVPQNFTHESQGMR